MIDPGLRAAATAATGFMPTVEGEALYRVALQAALDHPGLPLLELGTYCGKSAIWLAGAARAGGSVVFTVDHHRGSEENQAGWEHHDASLVDPDTGQMDTLARFRHTIAAASVEDVVIAVVGRSTVVAQYWQTPLAFCFIDGGHGVDETRGDYQGWPRHVVAGGTLAIHDVFSDPALGGTAPHDEIYLPALRSGMFRELEAVGSLRVLQRVS
jgi:hypothetical protein